MYNAHPYFSLKKLGRKVCVVHGKMWLLGHEGKALLHGISGLINGTPESSHTSFPPCEDAARRRLSATQKRALPGPDHTGTLISDSPPSGTEGHKSHPGCVGLWYRTLS